jgi:homoserine kinase
VGADLPLETERNVAGVAGLAFTWCGWNQFWFWYRNLQKIKAGSGIGSSAASAAERLWNQCLTGNPFETKDLVQAMQGETGLWQRPCWQCCPCPLGGFTLVRSYSPLDIIK